MAAIPGLEQPSPHSFVLIVQKCLYDCVGNFPPLPTKYQQLLTGYIPFTAGTHHATYTRMNSPPPLCIPSVMRKILLGQPLPRTAALWNSYFSNIPTLSGHTKIQTI